MASSIRDTPSPLVYVHGQPMPNNRFAKEPSICVDEGLDEAAYVCCAARSESQSEVLHLRPTSAFGDPFHGRAASRPLHGAAGLLGVMLDDLPETVV